MPENDREVFQHFRDFPEKLPVVASLAYALFAFDKFEWMKKVESRTGSAPTQEHVDRWIAELPDSRLEDVLQSAQDLLADTYELVLADERDSAYLQGKDDMVVQQVRSATSFWRNLPGNIAVGIVSSFAFALLLIAASLVFNKDPSPIAFYQKLTSPPAQPQK